MEKNNPAIDQLKKAVCTIENHSTVRDFQALEDILPLVLTVLKSKINESERSEGGTKFYAPIWVRVLINRLSTDTHPLSQDEYHVFRSQVAQLTMSDYKSADKDLMGYEPIYTTPQEISETVLSLKHYFQLL